MQAERLLCGPSLADKKGSRLKPHIFEKLVLRASVGEMAERFKAHAWKACWG